MQMWMIAFIVVDLFVGISVAALAIAQASQIARNVTTNELANWHRYKYLQSADNQFHNPFSKGEPGGVLLCRTQSCSWSMKPYIVLPLQVAGTTV